MSARRERNPERIGGRKTNSATANPAVVNGVLDG
jgi:hypothetical protein